MRDGREVDHHVTKASDLVRRNSPGGANWYFLAHMCAVAMYGYWEDAFRTRLADALGVAKNDLKADEFGELKELRHAVLHNRARGNEKTARFATMPPIAERAPVEIEPQVLLDIAASAKAACERLARGHSRPWV